MTDSDGARRLNPPRSIPAMAPPLLLLCIYCFTLQFTPSEPYLVPFLTGVKRFSNNDVTSKIFPVSVYSTLVATLLAIPACTYLRYRSVILIGTFGRLATFIILLFGKSLLLMQLMQVTYSLAVVSDLVFSSYIFVLVQEDMFQSMTSYTQATSTFSFLMAAELGQMLVLKGCQITTLLYISIFMVGLASVLCIFIPRDKQRSFYVSGTSDSQLQNTYDLLKTTWHHPTLKLLSFWWALQVGGSSMIENYGTNLFDAVDHISVYNGHVIAAAQGASCLAALVAVPVSNYTADTGALLYAGGSALTCLLCILMARIKVLWMIYLAYISSVAVNRFLLCVLYVQCAQLLAHGHYILLFSLNAVAAFLVQSALQTSMELLNADVFTLFAYLGNFFFLVTLTFLVVSGGYFLRTGKLRLLPAKELS